MSYDGYWGDYESKPIGGGNPYYCCSGCGLSDPQINGNPLNHLAHCTEVPKFFASHPDLKLWMVGDDQAGMYVIGQALTYEFGKNRSLEYDHISLEISERAPFFY